MSAAANLKVALQFNYQRAERRQEIESCLSIGTAASENDGEWDECSSSIFKRQRKRKLQGINEARDTVESATYIAADLHRCSVE